MGKPGTEKSYGTFGDDRQQEKAELRAVGRVEMSIFWNFFKAGNSYSILALYLLALTLSQVLLNGSDYWLKVW